MLLCRPRPEAPFAGCLPDNCSRRPGPGRSNMRDAAGDMHNDIAVTACGVRGGGHQQRLHNAFQFINRPHAVMQ